MRTKLTDPFVNSLVLLTALGSAGFLSLALTWSEVASLVRVANQIPYLVSGGCAGLALVGFALGLLGIQNRRWAEARRRADFERVVQAAREVLDEARKHEMKRPL